MLPLQGNAEPGRFKFSRTPYQRGMIDSLMEPGVEEVVWVCGTQIGKTTCQENLLGFWVDNDPGPALIVKPGERDVEAYIKERIRPLIETSLAHHQIAARDADTLASIRLDSMSIYFGWSGSPASLASRPCRYVLLDEIDKFVPFSGREADPVSLARERTKTFTHRKRIVQTSTPTTRQGPIWQAWESSGDQRYFEVPCLNCHHRQRLGFSQIKWPKVDANDKIHRADIIEQNRLAYYECEKCKARIEDQHKPKMLDMGHWLGNGRKTRRIGKHLGSLYSPWVTFSEVAAKFIAAEGDIGLTMNFRNSWLAEPFEVLTATNQPGLIRDKAKIAESANQRPEWANTVICTADVQKDRLVYVIRAWGYGFRSALLRHGIVGNFNELYEQAFQKPYTYLGADKLGVCDLIAIDGKYRTNEVFEFARRDTARILVTQGNPQPTGPMSIARLENNVRVLKVNTLRSKDRLNEMLQDGDSGRWQVNSDITEDYSAQMASEHRLWDQRAGTFRWEPKYKGIANHFWDCEANQCVIATWLNLDVPPAQAIQPKQQTQTQQQRRFDDSPVRWIDR